MRPKLKIIVGPNGSGKTAFTPKILQHDWSDGCIRVLHGGHDVPITKIISRYSKSIANAAAALLSADRGYVYDNSITARNPRILFRVRDGKCSDSILI